MGKLTIEPLPLAGAYEVRSHVLADERGAFGRFFCDDELASLMGGRRVVQVNHSYTRQVGALRGLHFQRAPHLEMKLVRCLRGRVWDVMLDMREGSDTFLTWVAVELTPAKANMVLVPEGCAHGFQALEADSEILYLDTGFYHPESEGGVLYNDPRAAIVWPLDVTVISARDRSFPLLDDAFTGLKI